MNEIPRARAGEARPAMSHGILKVCTAESRLRKAWRVLRDVWWVAERSGGARVTVRETDTHWVITISDDPAATRTLSALPGLLDLWEAATKDHHCVNEHWSWLDNPPHCPICAALDRIEKEAT